jgi:hypothetical protein
VRSRSAELLVQRVTKTAALIHRVHRLASGYLFFHPGDQLLAAKLPRRPDRAPLALDRYHDCAQVHIQAQFPYKACARFAHALQPFMASNGPIAVQVQRACHDTLPWLISFPLATRSA